MTTSVIPGNSILPELRLRLAEMTEKKKHLLADMEYTDRAIMAWSDALAREEERLGLRQIVLSSNGENGHPQPDKGGLFVQFAINRGAAGFSIGDLFRLYREQRVRIGKNYPYYLVDTKYAKFLRREGKTSKGKRYYWIGNPSPEGAASGWTFCEKAT